jgi:hypothetical protein
MHLLIAFAFGTVTATALPTPLAFVESFEAAVQSKNWATVEAAFDPEAEIRYFGPPDLSGELELSVAELLESYQKVARYPGYRRARNCHLSSETGTTPYIVQCVVEESHTRADGQRQYVESLEILTLSMKIQALRISKFEGHILGLPEVR